MGEWTGVLWEWGMMEEEKGSRVMSRVFLGEASLGCSFRLDPELARRRRWCAVSSLDKVPPSVLNCTA